MAQSVQHDPVEFDRTMARRAGLVALGWFLLVVGAIAVLLTFSGAFQSFAAGL